MSHCVHLLQHHQDLTMRVRGSHSTLVRVFFFNHVSKAHGLFIGTQYQVLDVIGEGAYGIVCSAVHWPSGRKVCQRECAFTFSSVVSTDPHVLTKIISILDTIKLPSLEAFKEVYCKSLVLKGHSMSLNWQHQCHNNDLNLNHTNYHWQWQWRWTTTPHTISLCHITTTSNVKWKGPRYIHNTDVSWVRCMFFFFRLHNHISAHSQSVSSSSFN